MKHATLTPTATVLLATSLCATGLLSDARAATPAPFRVEPVDDATLATQRGKYYGANLLVGLRIDLVSNLAGAGGTASAIGSLYVRRVGGGFEVYVDTRTAAEAADGVTPAATGGQVASGGETLHVTGIGQVTQIAGNNNRMANVTTIHFGPIGGVDTSTFNGESSSTTSAGGLTAQVSFLDGGLTLGLTGPGANLGQWLQSGSGGGLMQLGQIAGDNIAGANQMQLQMLGSAMSLQLINQLGIRQALSGMAGLGR